MDVFLSLFTCVVLFFKVLQVPLSEVHDLTGDPHASASPLLCLSQTPSMHFLQPITVQIPLPPGVTGTASYSRYLSPFFSS